MYSKFFEFLLKILSLGGQKTNSLRFGRDRSDRRQAPVRRPAPPKPSPLLDVCAPTRRRTVRFHHRLSCPDPLASKIQFGLSTLVPQSRAPCSRAQNGRRLCHGRLRVKPPCSVPPPPETTMQRVSSRRWEALHPISRRPGPPAYYLRRTPWPAAGPAPWRSTPALLRLSLAH